MIKILVDNTYYILDDKKYDKIYQDILMENPGCYTLRDNKDDIITYFSDNILEILNDLFIPIQEDNSFILGIINDFKNYLDYIYKLNFDGEYKF